jgi:hypothetical protein
MPSAAITVAESAIPPSQFDHEAQGCPARRHWAARLMRATSSSAARTTLTAAESAWRYSRRVGGWGFMKPIDEGVRTSVLLGVMGRSIGHTPCG